MSHDRYAVDRRLAPAATPVSVAAAEARGCDRLRSSRNPVSRLTSALSGPKAVRSRRLGPVGVGLPRDLAVCVYPLSGVVLSYPCALTAPYFLLGKSRQNACTTRCPTLRFGSPRSGVATGQCELRVASNSTLRIFGQGRRRFAPAPPRHLRSALLVNGAEDQEHNSLRSCCPVVSV